MTDVRLRDFRPDDVTAVHRWFNNEHVTGNLVRIPDEFSEDDARDWVSQAIEGGSYRKWAITFEGSEQAIGFVGLYGLDRHNGPELGALIGEPAAWSRGIGREAERQACLRGFEEFGVHRINGEIPATNEASKRVMTSLGFRREGVMRRAIRRGSDAIDNEIWGLLPEDFTGWPPRSQ